MARLTKAQISREETKTALFKALEANNLDEKYYNDQVEEYMKYYDNLGALNEKLKVKLDIDCLKEKRQVTKEMRSILMFLGLKPPEGGGGGFEDL